MVMLKRSAVLYIRRRTLEVDMSNIRIKSVITNSMRQLLIALIFYEFSILVGSLFLSQNHHLLTQHNVILTIAIYLCGSQFNRGSLSCVCTSGLL